MTRRDFLWTAAMATATSAAQASVIVPVRRIVDTRAKSTPGELWRFSAKIWPEAVRNFSQGGIQLQVSEATGEIRRSPGDRPIFVGLESGAINLVVTDHIPMKWAAGRPLAGVTVLYEGFHLCVIALSQAHGNQIPFISVNTCVHELLHALLQDIFLSHPKWYQVGERESRIEWYGTCLWLFHYGAAIRKSAQPYLARLH